MVKKRFLSKIIKKRKPDIMFVQETKLESVDRSGIQKIWGASNMNFACSNSMGASGGLLIIWNDSFFKASSVSVHRSFILIQGHINDFPCTLVNICAPNVIVSRRELWEELLILKANDQNPWCIGGDFNEIKDVSERVGCIGVDRGMRDFIEFCNNMEILDLPMLGRKFTWSNYQNQAIHSRLDRFLLSQTFLDKFKVLQWGLPRPISDHCPIMLLDDKRDWGPKPFRFMDMWLSHPDCLKIAKATWDEVQVCGWAGFTIVQKLRAIKDRLRVWNKEEFGNINCALEDTEAKLHHFDTLAEERQLNEEEKALRCSTKAEFWRLSKLSETLWKQKSRVKWLKLGDRNTRFFQVTANNRFKRNLVGSVSVNGVMVEDPGMIKDAAVEFFGNNFKEERRIRPVLEGVFTRKLESGVARHLEKQFEEKEILAALKGCCSFKAPGPDGFNFSFVKKGWDFLKDTVFKFFSEFYTNGKLTKGINSTFVALIPKVACPLSFKEYRPISMVGWVYKLLSKVLANRIKEHMPSIIGEAQVAFIGGK